MNTSALKTFAPAVRRQLIEAVTRKLDYVLGAQTPDYLTTFAPQVAALRMLTQTDRPGLIERVAYTWFNRLAALRFMDARGWHPFRARVLTPAGASETQPELLKLTHKGDLPKDLLPYIDPTRINDLLDGHIPSPDAQGEVYRHLVLAACRFYHSLLPNLFGKLDDETELLLPDDLLTEHSVIHGFRTEINDEDCGDEQRANVEILGWLYQFYNSERKDQVMARKTAVQPEDIPAVTQLFTPHWIARYLVENSLGRLWLMNHPGSRLRQHMPYYIEGEAETEFLKITKPEEIQLLDPAVGSGHMLTYAFDLLTLIYGEEGYVPTEIPALILRQNLRGLDICPRATQLSEVALIFKAREQSPRFFQPKYLVQPNIIELRDVRFAENELRDYVQALGLGDVFNQPLLNLIHQFDEPMNFGSLIHPCLDEGAIDFVRQAIEAKKLCGELFQRDTHLKVLRVLSQAKALTHRYHIVVANPPYMGNRDMDNRLAIFAKQNFPDAKMDLCTMFMSRSPSLLLDSGLLGMINMQSWMFLSSYEAMRRRFVRNYRFISMLHLGPHSFDSIQGEVVQTVAFVLCVAAPGNLVTWFLKLTKGESEAEKEADALEVIAKSDVGILFKVVPAEFITLPGAQFAYALSEAQRRCFYNSSVEQITEAEGQNKTGDNGTFLRLFWEVAANLIGTKKKWRFYAKGGAFRKWYGNIHYVVDWSDEARAYYRKDPRCRIVGPAFLNRIGVTWTDISSLGTSFRSLPADATFDMAGPTIFPREDTDLPFLLGLLNSRPVTELLPSLNPTLHVQLKDVRSVPQPSAMATEAVCQLVNSCRALACADWDNRETSWDFRDQPLLRPGLKGTTLEASWRNWETHSIAAVRRMQELETANNRLFIDAYGLTNELKPEVSQDQITLFRADARRDIAAFLSYAVGCMMGRYSLDQPGLILANPGDSLQEFVENVEVPQDKLKFASDEDGIIPVLDGEWFEDDIVARIRDFISVTFGEAALGENIRFIEKSLGRGLRNYFLTDFYKNHLQAYGKRPIYWMVQSPCSGFSVLVYLHRYTKDTINIVLNRYLRVYQVKLCNRIAHLAQVRSTATSARGKIAARQESDKLTKTLRECDAWERQTLLPLAQARIELDLDDGVKTNYLKLGEALAPIAGLATKE
jgi:Eco57I restriction-modification methylase